MDISVVIPVYNERDNLRPLVDEIEQALAPTGKTFEVIAVDDGSSDGSREVLRQLASDKAWVRVVRFRRNCGQTAAFDAGFRHARGETVVTMDADRQNDPKDIPALVAKLDEGFDLVTGWRKNRQDGAVLRKLPSRVANALIRYVTRTKVHDQGCSLKVYRKEITDDLRLYGEMHRFITVLAEAHGARVGEAVVHHRARAAGASKYGIGRTFKVVLDLLTVWFLRRYHTKPMYFFGGGGLVMLALAFFTTAVTAYEKVFQGVWVHRNPLFLVAVMLVLIGFQFVGVGLLAEVIVRTYFESQGRTSYPIAETINFPGPVSLVPPPRSASAAQGATPSAPPPATEPIAEDAGQA